MREAKASPGQQFQKTDGSGIVFEIVELVTRANMPHARLARLDNPGEERVIALTALLDKKLFTPTSGGALSRNRNQASDAALEPVPGD